MAEDSIFSFSTGQRQLMRVVGRVAGKPPAALVVQASCAKSSY